MKTENFIPISELSSHYNVEFSFLNNLNEVGLLEINTIEETQYVHFEKLQDFEKILRIHHELDINIEGIDIVFNLLQKIAALQSELHSTKNKLSIYESNQII